MPIMPRGRTGQRACGASLDTLRQDFRYACRSLLHSRGFTTSVVGSLAIGMAVTIAALALLNASMILPFTGVSAQHRLVRVSVSRNCGRPNCWIPMTSAADYVALTDGLRGLQGLAAYAQRDLAVALPEARSMRGLLASANYFDVLGVRPVLGRTFQDADTNTHAAIAVIADSTWMREFNGDASVIGRSIRVADQFVQIVGVAPPLFTGIDRLRPGGRNPDIWLPMWLAERVSPVTITEQRQQERDVAFVGRLKDGVAVPELQAQVQVLATRLAGARSEGSQNALGEVRRVWRVRPETWYIGAMVVMPIPMLVLAISCVNAANLMLARGSERQREIAIRLAIGAGRGRIVRQLLVESTILAAFATVIPVPIAWWSLQLASNPVGIPIPIDTTVLALTVLAAAGTTVAFGLVPAIRVSALRPSSTLGSTGVPSGSSSRESRMRRFLVMAQVALSLGLIATAWQLVSTVGAQAVAGGTPPDRLLIARFDLQPIKLAAGDAETFYRDLVAATSRVRGVEAAGVARHTSVWTFGQGPASGALTVWRPTDAAEEGRTIVGGYAGGDLFEAVGLRVIAGRDFTDADRHGRPQVAVINQTAARSLNGPALGTVLRVAPKGQDARASIDVRVVGIIEPALEPRLEPDGPPAAKIYLPSPLEPEPALDLYVRTHDKATTIAQPLRELVNRIAPRVPIVEIGSLTELNERSYSTQLWLARAAALLGVIGLLLATAGLYGVSSYVVAMQSREIAIRMAIGARPGVILAMILGHAMRVAAIGLLVGGGAAVVVSRVIQ
jgi:putative ABC transport system permease protein